MEFYIKKTSKELSQRKLEEYDRISKIVSWGRCNPVKFAEEVFGLKLMDYQKLAFMETWARPFCCWLQCRGAGKDTLAAVYFQTKLLLIPNYTVYLSSNSHGQSVESFKKIEDLALQRIPSFRSATDVFMYELERSFDSNTGFLHAQSGHSFRLYNNSQLVTLSSNLETIRGKRGSVWIISIYMQYNSLRSQKCVR